MKKVSRLLFVLLPVGILLLTAGCAPAQTGTIPSPAAPTVPGVGAQPPVGMPWGIIEIRATDPPPADVRKAVVFLSNIEVHKVSDRVSDNLTDEASDNVSDVSDNVSEDGGQWIKIVGAPPSFDLLDVIGVSALLGSANVTAGAFTQIRMDVTSVEVTTTTGDNFTAEIPSGKLKIVRPFNVQPGLRTVLTLDFDGEKSLIVTGKGKALFKPVVKLLLETGKPVETGKAAETGKPDGKGKPSETGQPGEKGKPAEAGKPSK